jgi:hypothetical protein
MNGTALAEFKPEVSQSLENVIDDARVRVYGDAAVVQARSLRSIHLSAA